VKLLRHVEADVAISPHGLVTAHADTLGFGLEVEILLHGTRNGHDILTHKQPAEENRLVSRPAGCGSFSDVVRLRRSGRAVQ
jgi:hypothetical protein